MPTCPSHVDPIERLTDAIGLDSNTAQEHARNILLRDLPEECDVLCTHPMFGPDSARHGWHGQTFVYERTRIDGVLLGPDAGPSAHHRHRIIGEEEEEDSDDTEEAFLDAQGVAHGRHENSEAHVAGMDRMERFLRCAARRPSSLAHSLCTRSTSSTSIWEEEGCDMVSMSCKDHDGFTANSQFITHLMGRILGAQGLKATPVSVACGAPHARARASLSFCVWSHRAAAPDRSQIDTKGFQNVLKLVQTTNADSFDLFYGLFKFNRNSLDIIGRLKEAMDDVVGKLLEKEGRGAGAAETPRSCL